MIGPEVSYRRNKSNAHKEKMVMIKKMFKWNKPKKAKPIKVILMQ